MVGDGYWLSKTLVCNLVCNLDYFINAASPDKGNFYYFEVLLYNEHRFLNTLPTL